MSAASEAAGHAGAPSTRGRTTLAELNRASTRQFVAWMGPVWEHAPWVAEAVAAGRPYASVDALHRAMVDRVARRDEADRVALFAGHPELAGRDARAGTMTPDSIHEQTSLAPSALSEAEAARWDALNAAHRTRFGFPFIVCVRRHGRRAILQAFERRLQQDRPTALAETLAEIAHITRLRLATRIVDHGLDGLAARVFTRVVDLTRGRPAEGVHVALAAADERVAFATARTDAAGHARLPLPEDAPLPIGDYRLVLRVADYFRPQPSAHAPWPFLDEIPIAFGVADPADDYHLAIAITPWSYAMSRT